MGTDRFSGYKNQHRKGSKRGSAHEWLDKNPNGTRPEFFTYVIDELECSRHTAHAWWQIYRNNAE